MSPDEPEDIDGIVAARTDILREIILRHESEKEPEDISRHSDSNTSYPLQDGLQGDQHSKKKRRVEAATEGLYHRIGVAVASSSGSDVYTAADESDQTQPLPIQPLSFQCSLCHRLYRSEQV